MRLDHNPLRIGQISLITQRLAAMLLSGGRRPHGGSRSVLNNLPETTSTPATQPLSKRPLSDTIAELLNSIREKTQHLQATLENMSDGIAVFDTDLHFVEWNQQYLRLNSLPEELVQDGRPFADIIRHAIARGDYGAVDPEGQLTEVIQRAQELRFAEVSRPDGTWVEIKRNRMPEGGVVMTYNDITERKQAEAELAKYSGNLEHLVEQRTSALVQANEQLEDAVRQTEAAKLLAEEADQAKTRFLRSVSHDLLTPLGSIIGFTAQVTEHGKDVLPSLQYENLEKVTISADRLSILIADILDYARSKDVHAAGVQLIPMVDECLRMVEPMVNKKLVRLENHIAPEFPSLFTDQRKLQRILDNLITNAIEFTHRGRVSVNAIVRDGEAEIAVEDTGVGIPEDALERIFEEFEQADTTRVRTLGGTGLGLAICRSLSELIGGRVSVQSRLGVGSTFTLTIPIRFEEAMEAEEIPTEQAITTSGASDIAAQHGGKILIVEDTELSRDLLVQLLSKDYEVLLAENGAVGVEKAENERPDLILMDLSLPVLDGWEATRRLKADERLKSIPVIAVTAHVTEEEEERARACGCDDFLPKPIDEVLLFEKLRQHLSAER